MWTKLLIIGIASNIIINITAYTKTTEGPEGQLETLYINESGVKIRMCAYRTNLYADGHRDSIPQVEEFHLNPTDSVKIQGAGVYQWADSVFVTFNEEKIWKNYRDSVNLTPGIYNGNEYQIIYPIPENENYVIQIFRFTPEHLKAARDLKE